MKIGVQFYTLRKYLKDENGYREAFKRIKEMNAETVQLSGALPVDAKTLGEISRGYDLPICSTHAPFERIVNDLDRLSDEHLEFDCQNIGVGMMPLKYHTGKLADLDAFILILNTTAEKLAKKNMTIAYHNHGFEFKEAEGKRIMDYLIEKTLPEVQFIPDTFWIKEGGFEPVDYIKKLSGRINTLHLKDYKKTLGIPLFRAIGKGTLDFKSILAAAEKAAVENAVVELDLSPDPYKSIKFSLDYLRRI